MKLSDAQHGALHQIVEHGPISAEEIIGGMGKVKFVCNSITAATMQKLHFLRLITIERVAKERPISATGIPGHKRNAVTINITDAGRKAIA